VNRQYWIRYDTIEQDRDKTFLERKSREETVRLIPTRIPNTPTRDQHTHSTSAMDETPDVATLVAGLVSSSESARKYAVFKLQGLLADPSFADAFIQADGLPALHSCVLESSGNAQAYALGSLLVLLELDVGWEVVDAEVVEKVSCRRGDMHTRRVRSQGEDHALIRSRTTTGR
jgi:hypothetical protein